GTCIAPTIFAYEPGGLTYRHVVSQVDDFHPGTRTYNSLSIGLQSQTRHLVAGDIDGDGKQDLVYRTYVDPTATGSNAFDKIAATESVYRLGGTDGFGDSHGAATTIAHEDPASSSDAQFLRDNNVILPPILADITGDGRADLITTYQQY